EWVALVGDGLHGATSVTVANRPAEVAGFLRGGSLLVRFPTGVPVGGQRVEVETPQGRASTGVTSSRYAFGVDTRADTLRFRRLAPGGAFASKGARDAGFE